MGKGVTRQRSYPSIFRLTRAEAPRRVPPGGENPVREARRRASASALRGLSYEHATARSELRAQGSESRTIPQILLRRQGKRAPLLSSASAWHAENPAGRMSPFSPTSMVCAGRESNSPLVVRLWSIAVGEGTSTRSGDAVATRRAYGAGLGKRRWMSSISARTAGASLIWQAPRFSSSWATLVAPMIVLATNQREWTKASAS